MLFSPSLLSLAARTFIAGGARRTGAAVEVDAAAAVALEPQHARMAAIGGVGGRGAARACGAVAVDVAGLESLVV